VAWAGEELNGRLTGVGLGARTLRTRLEDPSMGATEQSFLRALAPAFTELVELAEDSLYVDGAARLLGEHRVEDLSQINELMDVLERRVALLGVLSAALDRRDVLVRIGTENELPALRSLALVASGYGLPSRNLGTVSVIGPVRMDYAATIRTVREAARQLSTYIEDVYEAH
jgi:heat-inducible transcriptional repressor